MARVDKNSIAYGFRGRVGSLVFRRVGDQTIVSYCPKRPKAKKQKPATNKPKTESPSFQNDFEHPPETLFPYGYSDN